MSAAEASAHAKWALVLTVDRSLADIVREILRERRFAVARMSEAADAAARLRRDAFELVIIDQDAGGSFDAAQLVRALRHDREAASRRSWILVIARALTRDQLLRLRDAGVSSVLTGPLTMGRIAQRLAAKDRDRRAFIESQNYVGPDRRVRSDFFPPDADRRKTNARQSSAGTAPQAALANAAN